MAKGIKKQKVLKNSSKARATSGKIKNQMPRDLKHQISVINKRLYSLENKVNAEGISYAKLSSEYRTMSKYALEQPLSKNGKVSQGIYKVDYETGKIRLKGAADWESMTPEERKKLTKVVENIWENASSTTTVTGIKSSYNKAYETFMANHKEAREMGLTQDQYEKMWQTNQDVLNARKNEHFGSGELMLLMQGHDIGYLLDTDQLYDALQFVHDNEPYKIDRRAIRHNYERKMRD